MKQLATIGVYGADLEAFLVALERANVRRLLDLRQRRGVRGSEYSWANAQRLERELREAGIDYSHHKALAPTTELRHLQYAEDARLGVAKRSRATLAPLFVARYESEILDAVDLRPIVAAMPQDAATALLCVERDAEACHRSLVARRLGREFGMTVLDPRP